ncbi:hypothetical protein FQN50_001899 [Emmonsiellopsis sp. PD_5]|nr:hypothetical protein FQN50_001899 [Emmonsiellopsis sp. PD_5]
MAIAGPEDKLSSLVAAIGGVSSWVGCEARASRKIAALVDGSTKAASGARRQASVVLDPKMEDSASQLEAKRRYFSSGFGLEI